MIGTETKNAAGLRVFHYNTRHPRSWLKALHQQPLTASVAHLHLCNIIKITCAVHFKYLHTSLFLCNIITPEFFIMETSAFKSFSLPVFVHLFYTLYLLLMHFIDSLVFLLQKCGFPHPKTLSVFWEWCLHACRLDQHTQTPTAACPHACGKAKAIIIIWKWFDILDSKGSRAWSATNAKSWVNTSSSNYCWYKT